MRAFTTVTAKVAPLDRPNVDTDAIIPNDQSLKSIKRTVALQSVERNF
ncbi:hypothetical protein [Hydrocarboniphaga sp.]|nr:hypothetical protein [Hydrocarboniphaga sp.]MDZ4077237.1 hypothetical protein [Hydrocarboniphaga sp.]